MAYGQVNVPGVSGVEFESVKTMAQNAQTAANTANETASAAQETANTAQTVANEAKEAAANVGNHTHTEYAAKNHTHSEYSTTDHTHTGYLSTSGGTVNGDTSIIGNANVYGDLSVEDTDSEGLPIGGKVYLTGSKGSGSPCIAGDASGTNLKLQGHSYDFVGGEGSSPHPLSIKSGGTGATTAANALTNLGAAASNHSHSGYAASNHSHSGYASSSHTHSGYLSTSGGTVSGSLTVTGSVDLQTNSIHIGNGNSGAKINLGDGNYVYIQEATDDHLTISAKSVNFVPYNGSPSTSSNPLPKEWGGTGTTTGGGSSTFNGYITAGKKSGTTVGGCSTVEGSNNTCTAAYAHAEGYGVSVNYSYGHAEGCETMVHQTAGHAEGSNTQANGSASHAEGEYSRAGGQASHAEGYDTAAEGKYSHAGGYQSYAYQSGSTYAFAHGYSISAGQLNNFFGKYNLTSGSPGSTSGTGGCGFAIGNGTSSSNRSNAFRVDYSGDTYTKTNYHSSGADYAEYFEWADGNPNEEDRVGYFVTMDNSKIKKADEGNYILGIVSAMPCIIGNSDEDWRHRWIADDFGRFEREEISIVTIWEDDVDKNGNVIGQRPSYITKVIDENSERPETDADGNEVEYTWRYKENPDYDSSLDYVERKDRKEWDAIGMMGVLAVRDDGTCIPGGYCKCANGGIATRSDNGYYVISRVRSNIVKVIMR